MLNVLDFEAPTSCVDIHWRLRNYDLRASSKNIRGLSPIITMLRPQSYATATLWPRHVETFLPQKTKYASFPANAARCWLAAAGEHLKIWTVVYDGVG